MNKLISVLLTSTLLLVGCQSTPTTTPAVQETKVQERRVVPKIIGDVTVEEKIVNLSIRIMNQSITSEEQFKEEVTELIKIVDKDFSKDSLCVMNYISKIVELSFQVRNSNKEVRTFSDDEIAQFIGLVVNDVKPCNVSKTY